MSTLNVNTINNEAGTGAPDFPNGVSVNSNPIATAGSLSNRNKIINGNFDIWQRGTSFSAAGYGADRWVHNVAGSSGTVTQSRQAFTLGQTDVPNEPTYFYRIQGSSYTMTAGNVTQRIEDVRTFAGQTVTVSFYAKASAARELGVRFLQAFDGSANVITAASPVSLTTSWQKFTATVSIPSIAGKTVGPNSRLELAFDIKQGAVGSNLNNDSIDIAQVQLEAGDVATPFEVRPIGQELALCQRYFYKSHNIYRDVSASSGGYLTTEWAFPVQMRAVGTAEVFGYPSGVSGRVSYFTGTWNDTASFSFPHIGPNYFSVQYNNVAASQMGLSFTIDAEL